MRNEPRLILNTTAKTVHALKPGSKTRTQCGRNFPDGVTGWMWTSEEAYACGQCRWGADALVKQHRPAIKTICTECHGTVPKYGQHYHYLYEEVNDE